MKPARNWRHVTSRIEADRVNALSAATQATYDRHWHLWQEWAAQTGTFGLTAHHVARFIDWLAYERKWLARSIRTVLGGLSTIFALHKMDFPHTGKLIQMQLKGIARHEPPKTVSATLTPHMWLHIWTHGLLHEAHQDLVQTFVAVVILQYFGWRIGTVLRLKLAKLHLGPDFIKLETSHCKNTST